MPGTRFREHIQNLIADVLHTIGFTIGDSGSTYKVTVVPTTLTADRTFTLPNQSGTLRATGATGIKRIHEDFALGAGSGGVVSGADRPSYTVPASQTAATATIKLAGLKVGDVITAFALNGRIASAGQTVTLDAALRKTTYAAGAATDASLGGITQLSVTANTLVSLANALKTLSVAETVAEGTHYYILLTITTGSSTSVEIGNAVTTETAN